MGEEKNCLKKKEIKALAPIETKEPEMTDGNREETKPAVAVTATPALLMPAMNLELIQQFQAALHTIAGLVAVWQLTKAL